MPHHQLWKNAKQNLIGSDDVPPWVKSYPVSLKLNTDHIQKVLPLHVLTQWGYTALMRAANSAPCQVEKEKEELVLH